MTRLAPFPYGGINVLFAIAGMKTWVNALSSCIGFNKSIIPVYVGSLLKDLADTNSPKKHPLEIIATVIGVVLAIVVVAYCWFQMKKYLKEEQDLRADDYNSETDILMNSDVSLEESENV
ncbi:hypothetical protein HK096_002547 [Nowakowskiella sp. JEL0078]|nr:hypothetical protein HK096_002547 [Nowakowskiella sp. JEL0078]